MKKKRRKSEDILVTFPIMLHIVIKAVQRLHHTSHKNSSGGNMLNPKNVRSDQILDDVAKKKHRPSAEKNHVG